MTSFFLANEFSISTGSECSETVPEEEENKGKVHSTRGQTPSSARRELDRGRLECNCNAVLQEEREAVQGEMAELRQPPDKQQRMEAGRGPGDLDQGRISRLPLECYCKNNERQIWKCREK